MFYLGSVSASGSQRMCETERLGRVEVYDDFAVALQDDQRRAVDHFGGHGDPNAERVNGVSGAGEGSGHSDSQSVRAQRRCGARDRVNLTMVSKSSTQIYCCTTHLLRVAYVYSE